jgi:hypothetical protein
MKTHSPIPISPHGSSRTRRWLAGVGVFVAIVFAGSVPAQTPAAPGGAAPERSAEELEKLVGRIALYPDDLVAIILPAATNPLQLVQADRFLDKRKADPKLPIDEKWDDAVKSLLNYPEVVKSMSADLDWTSELGEAVVEDQGAVLEAVQVFRRKTQSAGNLKSDDKQTVVTEKEVIKIVPSDPQVVYVPQYNPSTVVVYGGYSSWGYYPAPYPCYYYPYPPGAALATGLIWGAAITAAWSGGHYVSHYGGGGNNNININRNTNVNTGDRNQSGRGGGAGGSQWKSNKQPGQVSSSVGKTARSGGAGYSGAGRASTQSAGGGAFSGASASGRQTQMDSSRGASSRSSSMSSPSSGARSGGGGGASSRSSMSSPSSGARSGGGGGARSSGGGGGGRGGGGGGGRR